jgi:secretion/DNA translocation related TadE-like protein
MHERGSVTLIVAASLAFAGVIGAFGADISRAIVARGRAQAAADAAALAAAQELVISSGRPPQDVAAEYAERGGARLDSCRCDPAVDEVVVSVTLDVHLPLLGQDRTVRARARAVVEAPTGNVDPTARGPPSETEASNLIRLLLPLVEPNSFGILTIEEGTRCAGG